MLLIDGKEAKARDLWGTKGFLPKMPKTPAVFKLPKSRLKKVKNRKGKTRIWVPNSFHVEALYTIMVDGALVEVRYFTSRKEVAHGRLGSQMQYTPEYACEIGPKGDITFDATNPDMIFFMAHHPRNASSPFKDTKKNAHFFLENKKEEASVLAEKERMKARAKEMLFGAPEALLSEKELRETARAMGMSGTAAMDEDQLRVALLPFAEGNAEDFIKNTSGHNMRIKAMVQEAIDFELLKFDKNAWYTLTSTGKKDDRICDVRFKEQRVDRLADHLLKNDGELLTHLESLVEEKRLEAEIEAEEALEEA